MSNMTYTFDASTGKITLHDIPIFTSMPKDPTNRPDGTVSAPNPIDLDGEALDDIVLVNNTAISMGRQAPFLSQHMNDQIEPDIYGYIGELYRDDDIVYAREIRLNKLGTEAFEDSRIRNVSVEIQVARHDDAVVKAVLWGLAAVAVGEYRDYPNITPMNVVVRDVIEGKLEGKFQTKINQGNDPEDGSMLQDDELMEAVAMQKKEAEKAQAAKAETETAEATADPVLLQMSAFNDRLSAIEAGLSQVQEALATRTEDEAETVISEAESDIEAIKAELSLATEEAMLVKTAARVVEAGAGKMNDVIDALKQKKADLRDEYADLLIEKAANAAAQISTKRAPVEGARSAGPDTSNKPAWADQWAKKHFG